MTPTAQQHRDAADVALFHAQVARREGERTQDARRYGDAAAYYREAANLYRYAAWAFAKAAEHTVNGARDEDDALLARSEAARLDWLAAGLDG